MNERYQKYLCLQKRHLGFEVRNSSVMNNIEAYLPYMFHWCKWCIYILLDLRLLKQHRIFLLFLFRSKRIFFKRFISAKTVLNDKLTFACRFSQVRTFSPTHSNNNRNILILKATNANPKKLFFSFKNDIFAFILYKIFRILFSFTWN